MGKGYKNSLRITILEKKETTNPLSATQKSGLGSRYAFGPLISLQILRDPRFTKASTTWVGTQKGLKKYLLNEH